MADDPVVEGGPLAGPALERMAMERPDAIYDDKNDLSLVSFLDGKLKDAVLRVPEEYRGLSEAELKNHCQFSPTRTDHALRTSFWREYDRASGLGRARIYTTSIYVGICSVVYFYERFVTDPVRVAWLVLPQQVYAKEMEAILHRCTQRLWDLVDMDVVDPKTKKVCPRRAEVLLKVIQEVQNRVKGMAVQRTEKKQLTLHASASGSKALPTESMEQLQARLAQLEGVKPLETIALKPAEEHEVVVVSSTRIPVETE